MARPRTKPRDSDSGVTAAVVPAEAEAPQLIVEILDEVEGFVNGKKVKPGDKVKLDVGTATNLVAIRHGKIVGSA